MDTKLPRKTIRELIEANESGVEISQLFKIKDLILKEGKKGHYLEYTLSDKTGELKWCKKWDSSEAEFKVLKKLETPLVFITGKTDNTYKNTMQIKAESIAIPEDLPQEAVNDFIPCSPYDLNFLKKELWKYLQSIQNPFLKQLCEQTVKDPDIKDKLLYSWAALHYHHARRSGLMEHICNLLWSMDGIINRYQEKPYPPDKPYKINRDLVIAGIFFHDLFKIEEYNLDGTYADCLGTHLPRGALYVREKASKTPDFPKEVMKQLEHILLSHHGTLAYGSPEVPVTVEAILVHHLDIMGSKLEPVMEAIAHLPPEQNFTDRLKAIDNRAYRGGMLLNQTTSNEQ